MDATPVSQRGPDDFVRAPPLVSGTRRFAARRSPHLGGGPVVGCRGHSVRAGRDGLARDDRAELVRSVDRTAADHAVRHALRDPRRARSSVSRAEDGAEPGAILGGERGRLDLPVQIAPRVEVSQRRPGDHRRCQVQLRTVPGCRGTNPEGPCERGRDRRSAGRALSPQGAVADFMTFYGTTATAAGIVVPKNYLMQIGDDAFKKHPIGAGPYKFVSSKPGVEVVLEADPGYWRRVPSVKTLVMRSIPDTTARALTLKTGEADIAYALDGV